MGSVALVHDFLTGYSGAERVLKTLHELYPQAPIYTLLSDEETIRTHFPKAKVITSSLQKSPFRNRKAYLLPWFPEAVESFDLRGFDTVISSSGAFTHGVITDAYTRHICYCHSPMRYAWDWHAEYLREKGLTSWVPRFIMESVMHKLRMWDAISAKRVDTWIANSRTVADRINTYYRQPASVIYPPVDMSYFDPAHVSVEKGDYFVSACRLTANKRVDQMIEAAHSCKVPLVLIGNGEEREKLESLAKALKAKVTFLGSVSEEEKRSHLANARAFLFAAEDDFGIAPVEALSMGTPVIALGRGGVTETVTHGKTGILYPDPNSASLADGIRIFIEQGISGNAESLRESARRFDTEQFIQGIRNVVGNE